MFNMPTGLTIKCDVDGWVRVTIDYSTYFPPYGIVLREDDLEDMRRRLNEWHLNRMEDGNGNPTH